MQTVQAINPTLIVGTPLQAPYYSATSDTATATVNIALYDFTVCSVGRINIADCDSTRCVSGGNDQYIRLYSNTNNAEVASNDIMFNYQL